MNPYKHCFYCKKEMSEEDLKFFEEEVAEYCCDGYMCGCRGLSVEPPICLGCANKNIKEDSNENND